MSRTLPHGACRSASKLGDYTTDFRVLILMTLALVVGAGGLAGAWILIKLIALVTNLVWYGRLSLTTVAPSQAPLGLGTVLRPVVGGLVVGLMARFGSERIRGHGIPEALEAILTEGSRMHPKVAVLKPISSAISIGSGGPFGAEGPIIMTGGALGSLIGQAFALTAAERKTLLAAGAAAGMTGVFGTPLAAVAIAVELLLFEWKPRSFIPVAVASIAASALRPLLFPHGPLFPFPIMPHLPSWGLIACVAVGLVAGLQSVICTRLLYAAEDAFERLPLHWMWWPAIGGLAVGIGGFIQPRALGVGYDVIGDLISGHLAVSAVTGLLLVKAVIWLIALSSGTSGGVLAPLLILGGALGWLEGQVLPGGTGLWAIIGMGAIMGGTMRTPFTGVLFAVELTGNVHLLTPVLAAATAGYAVTVLVLRRSILTEKISRRGGHLTREYGADPLELARVGEIMTATPSTLPSELSLDAARAFLTGEGAHRRTWPVIAADGAFVAMVSAAKLDALKGCEAESRTLAGLASKDDARTHPHERAADAAAKMIHAGVGRLPVVDPKNGRLVGIVSRTDLMRPRAAQRASETDRQVFLLRRAPRRGQTRLAGKGRIVTDPLQLIERNTADSKNG